MICGDDDALWILYAGCLQEKLSIMDFWLFPAAAPSREVRTTIHCSGFISLMRVASRHDVVFEGGGEPHDKEHARLVSAVWAERSRGSGWTCWRTHTLSNRVIDSYPCSSSACDDST